MAITYGLSATGLLVKPLSVVEDEIDAGLRGILGDAAGTDSDGKIPLNSLAGQLKALLVDKESAQWDLISAVHGAFDPSKAVGVQLDTVASITGTRRQAARYSVATGTCIGTPLTTLDAHRIALIDATASRFGTATGVVIATGTAFAGSGIYNSGNLVFTPALRTYLCLTPSGIAGPSGPSGIGLAIVSNQVTWKYLGDGVGYVHTPFVAEQYGAIGIATGSLNSISTPISGWNAVTNLGGGAAGALVEKDSSFRTRRAQELAAPGNATTDAIRANILEVNADSGDPAHAPPTSCTVFFNDTDFMDSNGVPPHSVEIMIQAGTDADLAQAIWDSVAAGTRTVGNTTGTAYDSEGNAQTVYWTRPTEIQIWLYATGRYDITAWPAGSDAVVAQAMLSALLTYTADWPVARDVRTSPLNGAIMRGPAGTTGGLAIVPADAAAPSVPGLFEVETLSISTATGVTGTAQISISTREIAVFDSSRCVITATTEEP